ncbi:hypothetical protein OH77DRAFT_1247049 [Trametes cingulata]|nr:hypothetical protein OH77DRAFT_1247049 [Trametes cingulata]
MHQECVRTHRALSANLAQTATLSLVLPVISSAVYLRRHIKCSRPRGQASMAAKGGGTTCQAESARRTRRQGAASRGIRAMPRGLLGRLERPGAGPEVAWLTAEAWAVPFWNSKSAPGQRAGASSASYADSRGRPAHCARSWCPPSCQLDFWYFYVVRSV